MDIENTTKEFISLYQNIYKFFCTAWDSRLPKPTPESFAVMQHLQQSGPLTLSEATLHFDRSPSATTELMQRVERQGWISKISDPDDRRKKYIWLTPKGNKVLDKSSSVLDIEQVRTSISTLTEEEQSTLIRLLRKITNGEENE